MSIKKRLNDLMEFMHPNKNEYLFLLELIIIAILVYNDFFFIFPTSSMVSFYLLSLLMIYLTFLIAFYFLERRKLTEMDFKGTFYFYSQTLFSLFLGIILSSTYLLINSDEVFTCISSSIPLIFLIFIGLIQKISFMQMERFIKKYIFNAEIWDELEPQTRNDFKQAEINMRTDNVPNAIINISKGIERELKNIIFKPFKDELNKKEGRIEIYKIIQPFKSDGSDPRERTYHNFKNYLEGKRHMTFGNIPFYLLNLTDSKIGNHTALFKNFSEFLQERFKQNFEKIIKISRILFRHDFFTISGIKISDLRNEAAHPQKNGSVRSDDILSIDNYIKLLKVLAVEPNLLRLIIDLKKYKKV